MKITVTRKTNAPAKGLWPYLADFSNIVRFHPMVNASYYVDGSETCEVGSTRQCDFKDGSFFKEQITELKEGSHYRINVVDSSGPVKDASAFFGLKTLEDGSTEILMEVDMTPKNILMQPMLYTAFKYKALPSVLKGLEDLYNQEHGSNSNLQQAS
jgi:hypothetical protein